jgi:hypothetical protein
MLGNAWDGLEHSFNGKKVSRYARLEKHPYQFDGAVFLSALGLLSSSRYFVRRKSLRRTIIA